MARPGELGTRTQVTRTVHPEHLPSSQRRNWGTSTPKGNPSSLGLLTTPQAEPETSQQCVRGPGTFQLKSAPGSLGKPWASLWDPAGAAGGPAVPPGQQADRTGRSTGLPAGSNPLSPGLHNTALLAPRALRTAPGPRNSVPLGSATAGPLGSPTDTQLRGVLRQSRARTRERGCWSGGPGAAPSSRQQSRVSEQARPPLLASPSKANVNPKVYGDRMG